MSEIRIDALTGLRAIVATGEAPSPLDLAASEVAARAGASGTERVLAADRESVSHASDDPLFSTIAWSGGHETIAHAGPPSASFAELSVEQVVQTVETWRERMRAHDGAAYVHVGVDERSGTPSCAELVALDFVPAAIARERERFSAHAVRTMGANLLEDIVQEEVRRRERIVAIDDEAVLWCPFASAHPFALTLAPRRRRERFQDDGATGAALLHRALTLLAERFDPSPPLSLWIRTAPRGAERFCWRIEIVPRLSTPGGLEFGTGLHVNPAAPEWAAAELRALA